MTSVSKMHKTIETIAQEKTGLIVGTQMVCKGPNWPSVALSVVLVGSYQLEYALDEQVAQNIIQVAGRAGRFGVGRAIMPFPLDKKIPKALHHLLDHNYQNWAFHYRESLGDLSLARYAKINLSVTQVNEALKALYPLVEKFNGHILGPTLDYPAHIGQHWKIYLLVKTPNRQDRSFLVNEAVEKIISLNIAKAEQISVDIDPLHAQSL